MYSQSLLNSSSSFNTIQNPNTQLRVQSKYNLTSESLSNRIEQYLSVSKSAKAMDSNTTSLDKRRSYEECVLDLPCSVPFPHHNQAILLSATEQACVYNRLNTSTDSTINLSIRTALSQDTLALPLTRDEMMHPSLQNASSSRDQDKNDQNPLIWRRSPDVCSFDSFHPTKSTSLPTLIIHSQEDKDTNAKKRSLSRLKRSRLFFKSRQTNNSCSPHSYSNTSSSAPSLSPASTKVSSIQEDTKYNLNISLKWYQKVWNLLRSKGTRTQVKNPVLHKPCLSPTDPVWYAQYKCSPSFPSPDTCLIH